MHNKIKALISTLIVALLIVGLFPMAASAADNNLVITASEVTAHRGETVQVVLNVTENSGFASLLINVAETEGFELVKADIENGSIMSKMTVGKNILWDSIEDSTLTGTLVTLTFKVLDNAKIGKNEIKVTAIESFSYDIETNICEDVTVSIPNIVINVEDNSTGETTPDGTNDGAVSDNNFWWLCLR